jgi:flagellar protein FlbD
MPSPWRWALARLLLESVIEPTMLKLTRLDHRLIAINPTLVAWIEETPDTIVCMVGGQRIIVREKLDEVIAQFVAFHERVGRMPVALYGDEAAAVLPDERETHRAYGDR